MAGYRPAGARAIRIDMLERLADLLRANRQPRGFEGNADMLSITGTTLEQFADLMQGLGYKAEKGTRAKAKPEAPVVAEPATTPEASAADTETAAAEAPAEDATPPEAPAEEALEVFFTFTWAPRPRRDARPERKPQEARSTDARPQEGRRSGKPKGGKPHAGKPGGGKGKDRKPEQPRDFTANPPRKPERIDPDNPFAAALMGLKLKG
jgi:ATP-dependent RNA helicase SUPV3L1/SUV3